MDNIKDLLSKVLDLGDGWIITNIEVNKIKKEIDIYAEYIKKTALFPGTTTECNVYDLGKPRRIRHLDLFEYKAFINVRIPRVKNKGKTDTRSIELSWCDERLSYSFMFEWRVIEALKMSKNQSKTADFFDTTFDIVHGIMVRAVERGLKKRNLDGIKALSLDEKSFSHGHKYLTILSDPMNKCVLDLIEGRDSENTEELLFWTLSPKQLENISLVSMDMWKAYMKTVREFIPQAQIVHDKFHTAKYLNKAVDETRKEELKNEVNLKKMKYIFLKDKGKWSENQANNFDIIDGMNLKTSRAWRIKENFKGIYGIGNKFLCLDYFKEWYINAIESELKHIIKVADTILKHLEGIVNSAVHEISNSIAENLNSQIQVVKSVARGFANFEGYRNSILFFQGNLKMSPL